MKRARLWMGLALAVVFLAQLAVPSLLIGQNESWRSQGTLVRFEARPVDPYDAFRGRYLLLELSGPGASELKTKVVRFYVSEEKALEFDPAVPLELEGYVSGTEFHPVRLIMQRLP